MGRLAGVLRQRFVSVTKGRDVLPNCHDVPFTSTINRDFPGLILSIWGKLVSINSLRQWHFADCKTVYPGSIPGVASSLRSRSKGSRAETHLFRIGRPGGGISPW
jgi:hypothetical protein